MFRFNLLIFFYLSASNETLKQLLYSAGLTLGLITAAAPCSSVTFQPRVHLFYQQIVIGQTSDKFVSCLVTAETCGCVTRHFENFISTLQVIAINWRER